MFRVRGDDEIEQNNPRLDQVRAQAQQGVERRNAIDKPLERAASHERCGIAKRQIERGYVLAKKLRAARDRIELRARACESRFGLVDAVHAESCLGQWNEQPSGTAHRIELRARLARQSRRIPRDLVVGRATPLGVVKQRGERAGCSRRSQRPLFNVTRLASAILSIQRIAAGTSPVQRRKPWIIPSQ